MLTVDVGDRKELWGLLTQARAELRLCRFIAGFLLTHMTAAARKRPHARDGSPLFASYSFALTALKREWTSVRRLATPAPCSPMEPHQLWFSADGYIVISQRLNDRIFWHSAADGAFSLRSPQWV
jgi:hypothetical protein